MVSSHVVRGPHPSFVSGRQFSPLPPDLHSFASNTLSTCPQTATIARAMTPREPRRYLVRRKLPKPSTFLAVYLENSTGAHLLSSTLHPSHPKTSRTDASPAGYAMAGPGRIHDHINSHAKLLITQTRRIAGALEGQSAFDVTQPNNVPTYIYPVSPRPP